MRTIIIQEPRDARREQAAAQVVGDDPAEGRAILTPLANHQALIATRRRPDTGPTAPPPGHRPGIRLRDTETEQDARGESCCGGVQGGGLHAVISGSGERVLNCPAHQWLRNPRSGLQRASSRWESLPTPPSGEVVARSRAAKLPRPSKCPSRSDTGASPVRRLDSGIEMPRRPRKSPRQAAVRGLIST